MRYAVMMNRFGYQVAGHLSAEEIFDYKQQGYRLVALEKIDYRLKSRRGRNRKRFMQTKKRMG